MIHTLLYVLFVLVGIAMIVLILLQRGAGAQAGAGFGAGASGTVFGARGSANFLSTATKYLAALFFGLSLFMAWQATRDATPKADKVDLGVMADLPAASTPAAPAATVPAPASALPAAAKPVEAPAPIIAPPASTPVPVTTPAGENAPVEPAGDGRGG